MPSDPDKDVFDSLNTNIAALTAGTNLFRGKMQPAERSASDPGTPAEAVFVLASGGPPQEAYFAPTTLERRFSGVQCRIRSDERDFGGGQTLARSVRDALHHKTLAGYIDVRVLETEPLYIAEDNEGHHEWSVNVELWHEETPP